MLNWLLILPLSQQTPGLLDRASLEGFDLNEQGLDCNTDFSVLDLSLARIVRNNVNLSTRSFNTGTRQGTTPPYAKEKTHEDFVKEVAAGPTVHRL